jgi:hypothetical protein
MEYNLKGNSKSNLSKTSQRGQPTRARQEVVWKPTEYRMEVDRYLTGNPTGSRL